MKKLFTLFAAAMVSVAMFATDPVVIDFTANPNGLTEQLQSTPITVTSGVITITLEQASSTTVPVLSTDMMKVYKSSQITIASSGENIKSITFETSGASYGADGFNNVSAGTLTGDEWAGDTASITFVAGGHQVRLSKVTVRFEDYTPIVVTVDTIGVNEAKARIDAGTLGKCYVKGVITSIDDSKISQYGNVNCWMVDIEAPADTLEGYKMNGANNAKYTAASEIEYVVGDTVLFYASALKKYNSIYEINEGYFVENYSGSPIATIDTLTVAEAMTLGNSLADNAESDKVVVIGYVAKVKTAYDATYGNETVYLSDDATATYGDFYAYRCKIDAPGAVQGDKVAVTGKILKYVGTSGNATIEISQGTMEVIEHATAVENVEAGAKVVKTIENGQLVIIKNGVRYNAQGAQL